MFSEFLKDECPFLLLKIKEADKKMARRKEMCSLKSNEPGAGIVLMKLDEIHRFEGHPFKVERNQELIRSDAEELLASARGDMSGYP